MTIPHKSSFKFGELSSLTGIKPYVIRFWETEFTEIDPVVSEDGQKNYSRADVEILLKIKALLFEHKLSLQEAKAAMSDPNWKIHAPKIAQSIDYQSNEEVKSHLIEGLSLIRAIKSKYNW